MTNQLAQGSVRPAEAADEPTLFGWRNDPWIIQQGLSGRTVSAEEHHSWFAESLQRLQRELFLVEVDRVPAGMIRYDEHAPEQGEVSIYLLPPYLGQGHGSRAFAATAPDIVRRRGWKTLLARVRNDNSRSLRFFQRLGFRVGPSLPQCCELLLEASDIPPNPDRERIATFFNRLVDLHGYSPQALDTSSAGVIQPRYEVLGNIADLRGRRVLDVGCGFGDLGAFLLSRWGDTVDYTGIDISARMIEVGRTANPGLRLVTGDLMDLPAEPQFDVVLAQGIFYLLEDNAEKRFFDMIARMYSLAKVAAGFCTISNWAERQQPREFYADPLRTLDFCRGLTPILSFRHDYLPNDFSVFLYRNEPWRQTEDTQS
ncbi:MAG: GNAT family N-acetyltransferase [Acidobacteriia bacterium]|nr:GNAT family N-acetyltransferase [Terriglobia bacterium]